MAPLAQAPCFYRNTGFSLIEVTMVLALVAGLSLLVVPGYQESVRKAKRSEARVALYTAMQAQERYFTQHHRYLALSPAAQTYEHVQGPHAYIPNFAGSHWSQASWRIAAQACEGHSLSSCVLLRAFPGYAEADYGQAITALELNSHGVRSCQGSQPQLCW